MSAIRRHRNARVRAFVGADLRRTRHGYTLTLHRKEGVFTVLDAAAREPQRWRRLEHALAFLVEHFGAISHIRLTLHGE